MSDAAIRPWRTCAAKQRPADIVEEVLSMRTGSHVLAAFNVEFDSFVDNVVFAAFIDRVGKYQLTMQRVCAYRPMAQSMPPMLREEAFHLAAGVIPLRRWVDKAARGDPLIGMPTLQKAINKWFGRALEMFGREQGGETVVRLGLKDLPNAEAQSRRPRRCTGTSAPARRSASGWACMPASCSASSSRARTSGCSSSSKRTCSAPSEELALTSR